VDEVLEVIMDSPGVAVAVAVVVVVVVIASRTRHFCMLQHEKGTGESNPHHPSPAEDRGGGETHTHTHTRWFRMTPSPLWVLDSSDTPTTQPGLRCPLSMWGFLPRQRLVMALVDGHAWVSGHGSEVGGV